MDVTARFCAECGARRVGDAKYCGQCGAQLAAVTPTTAQDLSLDRATIDQATPPNPDPTAARAGARTSVRARPGFPRPTSAQGAAVAITLIAHVTIGALLTWARYREGELLRSLQAGGIVSDSQLDASDAFIEYIANLYLPAYVLTLVAFLAWVYTANRRARDAGAQGMRFSPRASVLWFFAPIANVIQPFRIVQEIWKAADPNVGKDRSGWKHAHGSPLVALWWLVFLGMHAAGRSLPNTIPATVTMERVIQISQTALVFSGLLAAAALLALAVVLLVEQRLGLVESSQFEQLAPAWTMLPAGNYRGVDGALYRRRVEADGARVVEREVAPDQWTYAPGAALAGATRLDTES